MKINRRTYVTNPGLQFRFTLFFALASLTGNMLSLMVFNSFAVDKLDEALWTTHISIANTGEILRPLFISVNIGNLVFIAVLLVLTALFIRRKTAGPLLRMSKDIHRIAGGDLSSRIVLRKGDEFRDVADELNDMREKLRERFARVKDRHSSFSSSMLTLKKGTGSTEERIHHCDSILKDIEEMERELTGFAL